jgi:hypothetical protein
VRLTEAGLEVRPATPLALLISDGIVEGSAGVLKRRRERKSRRRL